MTGRSALLLLSIGAGAAGLAGAREVAVFLAFAAALVAILVVLDERRVRDSRRRNRR